jgi:hypothetical protein
MRNPWLSLVTLLGATCFGSWLQAADPSAAPIEIAWKQGAELTVEGRGWTEGLKNAYDRLPAKAEGKVTKSVWWLSHHSSGLRVRFRSDAKTIYVHWTLTSEKLTIPHMPDIGVSGLDLYCREKNGSWGWLASGQPKAQSNRAAFPGTPGVLSEYLLYLPLYNGVSNLEIGVSAGSRLEAAPARAGEDARPVVFYGTSITQGSSASRPGLAFTAIVGRRLDAPIVNLGFSGSGKMEPAMSDLLSEIDARLYVVDCLWNMSPEMFQERAGPFLRALRAKRPSTPILLLEDSNVWNTSPTDKGRIARDLVEKLSAEGIKGLCFQDNENMLGTDREGTVDGCHPNDIGMVRCADALTPVLEKFLKN